MRDEERDIAEWLAWQFAIGIDTCLVHDNGSTDRTRDIVQAFARVHDVRLFNWRLANTEAQPWCYEQTLYDFGDEFDWIAFIDSDELIVPHVGDLKTLLSARRNAPAIVLNWAMFGSSGHVQRPPGLMIETFRRRAHPAALQSCRLVKFIVRPYMVEDVLLPCLFSVEGQPQTPSGRPVAWDVKWASTVKPDYSVAQINHYFTRAREDWDRKLARGYRGGINRAALLQDRFAQHDRNEVKDRTALRFLPKVRAILRSVDLGSAPAPDMQTRDGIAAAYRAGLVSQDIAAARRVFLGGADIKGAEAPAFMRACAALDAVMKPRPDPNSPAQEKAAAAAR